MTDAVRYDRDADGVVTLTFDQPGQSANVMNADYMTAMGASVDRLERDRDAGELRGVILASAKPTFFAGGDLEMLRDVDRGDLAEFRGFLTDVKAQLRRLERLGRPVVAAINGSALGGGLEIALACHRRIALDDPAVRIGFPEVTLGLLPGAGGIVRSVRLLGLTAALPLLVEGTQLGPGAAAKAGLVDELAATPEDVLARARGWIDARAAEAEGPVQPWDHKGFRVPGQPTDAQGYAALSAAPAMLTSRTHGAYLAPERILAAAVEGSFVDVDTALEIETRYFCDLVTGQVAKNMIGTLWFGRNEVARGASKPPGYEKRPVRTLGVLGAGMMGAGIAHVSAYAGIDVVLADVTADQARAGRDRVAALLDERVAKGRLTPGRRDEVLSRITVTDTGPGMEALAECDLVVEAVFEDRAVKNAVHAAAERAAPRAFLASNTSTLPITGLAAAVQAPERFVGLHFFSPVHRMPLVEIIRGAQTSPVTLAAAFDFVRQIGKLPIIVNDGRGFFTSRVFGTYVTEGIAMVVEGVPPAVVENTARTAGFPVGPLAVADEVSLTLLARVRAQEMADLAAEGHTPAPSPAYDVIEAMVELNRPGKGGGAGFYDYGGDDGRRLWPELAERFATGSGEVPVGDVADRLLFVQALEALRCLNEGVVQTARDANVGTVLGIGFPAWTGGAAQFVSASGGPAVFTARAKELMARYGERFQPPPIKW
ncbi:3-hydroxyacyl-CoA dehydrogenase NAD-binding domain-containing protein [Actinopolymorpha sp. NPDC004070]|uniref:3-hydroxyacyl-CoA dehydrogenase NAD-binding domain-containing protein n=1 Tax=Actinopolymorpha sp. NPDC004070 TaxID=3154548 RepID=UPI0033B12D6B